MILAMTKCLKNFLRDSAFAFHGRNSVTLGKQDDIKNSKWNLFWNHTISPPPYISERKCLPFKNFHWEWLVCTQFLLFMENFCVESCFPVQTFNGLLEKLYDYLILVAHVSSLTALKLHIYQKIKSCNFVVSTSCGNESPRTKNCLKMGHQNSHFPMSSGAS